MTASPGRAGLQPERTALAWQRTAITATVVIFPLVVVNARLGFWLMTAVASVATTAAGLLVVVVRRRFRQLSQEDSSLPPFDPMRLVATLTILTASLGLVTALLLVRA